MKCTSVSRGLLLGLTMLLATSLFAASNKGSLQTLSDVTVSGTKLPAGEYSLNWEGTGQNVQLNIMKGKKVVATTPATLMDLSQVPSSDSAVIKDNGDGTKSLAEVRFGGKKYALQIGQNSGSGEGSTASK
ncbi:MAG TPA: hypothetical protein VEI49_14030 [Terriglobales bacterium]|nr:hypothetical protein [Terriglobales bacterium]HXY15618.1 hypothetical protein [Terriglobales bacterium]